MWQASYLPFGGVHATTGDPINLRFPGQWFQSESGLHQNWMRDYDPTTGRYIQADPLGLVDGASVYNYALQNPGRYVDPRGLSVGIVTPREGFPSLPNVGLHCVSDDSWCWERESRERNNCRLRFASGRIKNLGACLRRAQMRRDLCRRGEPDRMPEWDEESDFDPDDPLIPIDRFDYIGLGLAIAGAVLAILSGPVGVATQ
ncbi:RHS repeat-associated core domain-containing protein [Aliiroseovarius halocynthiae]|uniref:RHS repeat-associated core domain-containing protein n=1 Tax=Aliiroseovarius halocynthiae TaxID=985055 RepID=A0A545SLG0_9RHOB|nr:RHS repeat-associated core domain-containing protein [Aliiroseovarius halocynthiae]